MGSGGSGCGRVEVEEKECGGGSEVVMEVVDDMVGDMEGWRGGGVGGWGGGLRGVGNEVLMQVLDRLGLKIGGEGGITE